MLQNVIQIILAKIQKNIHKYTLFCIKKIKNIHKFHIKQQ